WKRERFAGKNYREEHRKWYLGDSVSAGIGQGYNAFTPVQQAEAIATIASDGVAFRPHLVRSIENVKTGVVRYIAPELSHTLAVLVENGGFGAQAAAPIARAVFDYYLLGRAPAAASGEAPRPADDESD